MSDPAGQEIAERVASVRARAAAACARSGRDPASVSLVAVSKTTPARLVLDALKAGVTDFGENRVHEGLEKQAEVAALTAAEPGLAPPRWHLIGHLQRNKARAAAGGFAILHAVDSARLIEAIAAARADGSEVMAIMLEVNVAGEHSKFGVAPLEAPALIAAARSCPAVRLLGLMTVAPQSARPEDSRPFFRELRRLADGHGLECLSMGMTGDFEVAIEEGATHVRVGRAIFGERG